MKYIICLITLLFTFLVPIASAASFGISPPWIINENLKPGSNVEYRFDLSTNDPSEDMLVDTKVNGDSEISKWLTIRDQNKLAMYKGQKHVYMYVDLKVPKDAKVKKYNGLISVKVTPKMRSKSNVAINLGGSIRVQLGVVNYDIKDYKIKSTTINSIVGKTDKIDLKLKVQNLGNTSLSDIKTNIQIKNDKNEKVLTTGSASKFSKTINPHQTEEVKLSIPLKNEIVIGKYWADVDIFKDDKSIYTSKIYFTVDSSKTVLTSSKGNIKTSVRVKDPFEDILVGIIALVLSLIIVDVKLRLEKRRKKLFKF